MYMIDVLNFTNSFSSYLFVIAFGSTYLLQIIGGYICDRYLGNRKTIIIGIILILLSQLIFTYDVNLFYLSTNISPNPLIVHIS